MAAKELAKPTQKKEILKKCPTARQRKKMKTVDTEAVSGRHSTGYNRCLAKVG
jgi:hypothetical protein